MKYAALKFNSFNIGDEIQSISAQRFLPRIDYFIFREQLRKFTCDEKVKLIMNSWYMWRPQNFPPRECVDPLLISMYFNPNCREALLSSKTTVDFFKKHGPVGCRDLSTKNWLEENNIPAYYSSCLTSTLIPNENLRKRDPKDYILLVDCPDSIMEYVKHHTDRPVYSFNKHYPPCVESLDRRDIAKAVLLMYQNAFCVITTNLHTAIPCLAFNTKVCMLKKDTEVSWGIGRFEGMDDFFNWESEETFLSGHYDFNHPLDNPKAFEYYRDQMIEKCVQFTGYDANRPTLDDDFEPVHTVLSAISSKDWQYERIKRTLYYARRKDLLKMLILKTVKRVNWHDIESDQYLQLSDLFKRKS